MKKINMFLIALLTLSLSSCKDFLDVEPSSSGDSKTSIQTPADAKVMVNGIMRNMTSSSYYGRNLFMYGDAKGGDLTVQSRGRGLDQLYVFDHSAGSSSYSGFWTQIYYCILQANNLLEGIDKIEVESGASDDFDTFKGQALTARAIMYFDLVRLYGKSYDDDKSSFGVPNIITVLDDSARPLRASVEENYTQILADLKTAEPLLSKSKATATDTKNDGYITYYTNLAMQARVYLYMKDYTNALKAAEEIINSNKYTLYTNNNWVDSWKSQFGSESIFELGIFPSESDLGTASLSYYLRRKGDGGGAAAGWFMASDYYLDRLGADADDVRWGVLSGDETSTPDAPRLGSCYKYSGGVGLEGDGKSTATAVNIKVIRLSEIYLIAAEAALPTNKELAAEYLNEIRKRSPNLTAATESTITIDMILDERSKELFAEGQKFFDMIRLNKTIKFNDDFGGIVVTHRPVSIDRSFPKTILPISQDEINRDPGLEAQQNPGY